MSRDIQQTAKVKKKKSLKAEGEGTFKERKTCLQEVK